METLKLKAEIREKTGGLSSKKAIYENKLSLDELVKLNA